MKIGETYNFVKIPVEDGMGNVVGELILPENYAEQVAEITYTVKESPSLNMSIKIDHDCPKYKIVSARIEWNLNENK
jgi:hypothetical protein